MAHTVTVKEVVLLGLIAEEPTHAYALEEKIRARHMTEWTEIGFSSIYRVLGQLERKRLVSTRLEHAGQGATRKVHSITKAGAKALADGILACLSDRGAPRTPFQVGMAFLVHAAPEASREAMSRRLDHMQRILEQLRTLQSDHVSKCCVPTAGAAASRPPPALSFCTSLIFEYALRHLQVDIDFVRETISRLPSY